MAASQSSATGRGEMMDTVDFESIAIRQVITEYFHNTSRRDEADLRTGSEKVTTAVAEPGGTGDERGSTIQPPEMLNPTDSQVPPADEENESFSSNAGKPDKKLSADLTCSCRLYEGQPCYLRFKADKLLELRMHHLSLEKRELDAVLLSQINASLKTEELTCNKKRHTNTERKKVRSQYRLHGYNICRTLFMHIHGIGKDLLDNLIKHYRENGLAPRQHGNKNKAPKHALTLEQQQKVVVFIETYAETHGIKLAGKKKTVVYQDYAKACNADGSRCVAKRTFQYLWKKFIPKKKKRETGNKTSTKRVN
ncbi:uncharacterized protein [Littorina saxatilis]|uniref:Uncharacterized protein n=1 Tax=Littorina saxatilis TaxID=31220 RepID=A0AAN9BTA3_9CAEN